MSEIKVKLKSVHEIEKELKAAGFGKAEEFSVRDVYFRLYENFIKLSFLHGKIFLC